jgi:glycosyltransferase involved in cell wall biosynthesis
MPPAVSIVIPCHARAAIDAALLAETLDTVSRQRQADYEIIVVDDGSSWSIDGAVRGRDRLDVVRQPQSGPASARNAGIAAARGEYLIFPTRTITCCLTPSVQDSPRSTRTLNAVSSSDRARR